MRVPTWAALRHGPGVWGRRLAVRLPLLAAEAVMFVALFGLYYLGRGFRADRPGPATENAGRVIDFERALGFSWERSWHGLAVDHELIEDAANVTYVMLHLAVIFVLGALFFLIDMRRYRVLRNAMLLSGLIAIPIYHLFPLTPPRLLEVNGVDLGFVDTVGAMRGSKADYLTNNYAAMPSYHFGWILLIVVYGVWWYFRWWQLRAAAVVFAAWTWVCIVFTANHYFVDMIAGAGLVTGAFVVALWWERFMEARPTAERRWFFVRWEGADRLRLPF